jgi:integrase
LTLLNAKFVKLKPQFFTPIINAFCSYWGDNEVKETDRWHGQRCDKTGRYATHLGRDYGVIKRRRHWRWFDSLGLFCHDRPSLFLPVKNDRTGTLERHLDPGSVYRNIVIKYASASGISAEAIGVCVHSMRATAATNALPHEADIAKVQEWLRHANVSTTRLSDRRKTRPEDSPTFHVKY